MLKNESLIPEIVVKDNGDIDIEETVKSIASILPHDVTDYTTEVNFKERGLTTNGTDLTSEILPASITVRFIPPKKD